MNERIGEFPNNVIIELLGLEKKQRNISPELSAREIYDLLYPPDSMRPLYHPLLSEVLEQWETSYGEKITRRVPFMRKIGRVFERISPKNAAEVRRYKTALKDDPRRMIENTMNVLLWGISLDLPYWPAERSKLLLKQFFSGNANLMALAIYLHYLFTGNELPPLYMLFEDEDDFLPKFKKLMEKTLFWLAPLRIMGFYKTLYDLGRLNITTTAPRRYEKEMKRIDDLMTEKPHEILLIGGGPVQPFDVSRKFAGARVVSIDLIYSDPRGGVFGRHLETRSWQSRMVYFGEEEQPPRRVSVGELIAGEKFQRLPSKIGWKVDLKGPKVVLIPGVWDEKGRTAGWLKKNILKNGTTDLVIITNVLRHHPPYARIGLLESALETVGPGSLVFVEGGWLLDRDRRIIGGLFKKAREGLKVLFLVGRGRNILSFVDGRPSDEEIVQWWERTGKHPLMERLDEIGMDAIRDEIYPVIGLEKKE